MKPEAKKRMNETFNERYICNFEKHWSLWGVSHLRQVKLLNCNQILGHVKDQNYAAFIDSLCTVMGHCVTQVYRLIWSYLWQKLLKCKSLHTRKSFVLGELSFARMPSRQYCLKVNKAHCWNCQPELVNCGQWQPSSVVTQHGMTQILGLPKLLQKLIPPHICWN